jgi:glycerol-3-phosphate dehydrogenase subunit C
MAEKGTQKSGYDLEDPAFWSPSDLDHELRRVFSICNGCRLCYNLCPSFPALLNRIDELDPHRGDAEGALLSKGGPIAEEDAARALAGVRVATENPVDRLKPPDLQKVVDLCYNCKLCFPICPYVPPHEFAVDFPRLMLRAKAVTAHAHGVTLQDKFLGATDLLGSVMTKTPGAANWAQHNAFNRMLMEKTVGIDRDRNLPDWTDETFDRWWERRAKGEAKAPFPQTGEGRPKVVLFPTCSVNYNDPQVGRAAVEVLERSGVTVISPPVRCCGMPALDGGDIPQCLEQIDRNVQTLLPYVREGYSVVTPGPTCTFMLRQEVPELRKTDEAREVAAAVRDLGEYLMELSKQGMLNRDFGQPAPSTVAYHFPCHLKVQKIGYKSRDLLRLIPGTEVKLVDSCCGMDGTWGMKKEFFQLSLGVAQKPTRAISGAREEADEARPERAFAVASDCPLAALQLENTTGQKVRHPVVILRDAYRAADEAKRADPEG